MEESAGGSTSRRPTVLDCKAAVLFRLTRTAVSVDAAPFVLSTACSYDMQDPSDKRKIIVDEKLSKFLTPPVDMFSMNKQLSKHCFVVGKNLVWLSAKL